MYTLYNFYNSSVFHKLPSLEELMERGEHSWGRVGIWDPESYVATVNLSPCGFNFTAYIVYNSMDPAEIYLASFLGWELEPEGVLTREGCREDDKSTLYVNTDRMTIDEIVNWILERSYYTR